MVRTAPRPSADALPYTALLEGSLQGVLVVSADEIVLANSAAAGLFGAAELTGQPLAALFPPAEAERLRAAGHDRPRGGAPASCRVQGRTLEGRPLHLEVAVQPVPWGGRDALQVTLLDHTALEETRAALAEREAQFHQLIDGSLQGIYVHVEHRLLFVNHTLAEMLGYGSVEEVLEMGDALALYAPGERERLLGYYHARVGGGAPPVRYEFEGLRKDGTPIWLENRVRVVTWQGREAILATVVDISERKRAERALLASEQKYRDLVEGSMQALLIQREGRALFVNQAFVELLGFGSPEEVYALPSLHVLVSPEFRETIADYARARMRGGDAPDRYVGHALRKDGADLWLDTLVRRVNWEGGPAIQATLVDVTERIRAERELQAQQRLMETVVNTIPHSVYAKGADLRFRMVNRAFCEAVAEPAGRIIGRSLDELAFANEDVQQAVREADAAVLATGEPRELRDVHMPLPDGRVRRRDLIKYPLLGEQGEVEGLVGLTEDVTERLEAEEGLRASERLMRMVIDHLPYIVFVKDRGGRYRLVNAAFGRYHGLRGEALIGHTLAEVPLGDEADRETMQATDRQVTETGRPVDVPQVQLTPVGGTPGQFHLQKLPLHDESGAIVGLVGLAEDITGRVRAQEEIRSSQRLLRTLIDTLPHAIYVRDRDLRYRIVNRAMAAYHGQPQEALIGKTTHDFPRAWTPQLAVLDEADRRVLTEGVPVEVPDVELTMPDGTPTIRRVVKMPLLDDHGEVVGLVGISEDITARKRAEQELQASRRLLQTVFDTIPTWLFVKDRESRFVMVNDIFAREVGRTPEDFRSLAHGDAPQGTREQRAALRRDEERVIAEGTPVDKEEELTLPDGTFTLRHVRKMPLRDEHGEIVGLVGISEDITARKRAEQELQASRRLLQSVFNLLPLWVFVKDERRRFRMINRQMAEDYGLTGEVEPGTLTDLATSITEEEKSAIYELDQRVLDTGRRVEVPELPITLPAGETRLFRTVRMPLHGADGAVAGIVGIAEDITERKRTEQAIQQAQKLESLGVLAGGVAHDFNNLLVSILGNASLAMLDLPAESPALPPLAQIETAGQRAAELCRQMLAYSGKGSFEIALVHLNALIEEMTQLLRVSLAKSIALNYAFDPALPPVEVDPTQIRQVVMNLVMNAAEAIGERPGSITLTTGVVNADRAMLRTFIHGEGLPEGRYVRLEVVDSGEGIPREMLHRIFDPFFTTKFAGRGLGLAAVLGIVRGHQGAMQVVSSPGEGATFRLLLPAQDDATAGAGPAEGGSAWHGAGTVLIVDDEQEVREVLERMVASLGFTTVAAASGPEGVERLLALGETVRAVMLDVTMPGLDGIGTLERLRAVRPNVPVVLLSGYAERDVQARYGDLAVDGFLQKPFTRHALAARLQAVLGDAAGG